MGPEGSLPHSQVPLPVPILSQLDPVHTPTSQFLETHLNITAHLCLGLPNGLFPSGFSTKTLYTPLLSPHPRYMPHRSHSSQFYHPNNIGREEQMIKLVMQFSPLLCYPVPLRPKYSPKQVTNYSPTYFRADIFYFV
jgi:hypothetical protein